MICNDCIKRDVCKHKKYFDRYCGLELKRCECKKVEGPMPSTLPNIAISHLEDPKRPKPKLLSREEIDKKIAELTKLNEEPPKLREIAICEICNKADYKDQMHECAECGRLICDDCSLELLDHNADSGTPMATDVMCNECWEKVGLEEDEEGDDDE